MDAKRLGGTWGAQRGPRCKDQTIGKRARRTQPEGGREKAGERRRKGECIGTRRREDNPAKSEEKQKNKPKSFTGLKETAKPHQKRIEITNNKEGEKKNLMGGMGGSEKQVSRKGGKEPVLGS